MVINSHIFQTPACTKERIIVKVKHGLLDVTLIVHVRMLCMGTTGVQTCKFNPTTCFASVLSWEPPAFISLVWVFKKILVHLYFFFSLICLQFLLNLYTLRINKEDIFILQK